MLYGGSEINTLSGKIIECCYQVHTHLGPGLLESVYSECLAWELSQLNIPYISEVSLPVLYKGIAISDSLRCDFLVDRQIILELKAVETILPVHKAQLLTYLKLAGIETGLLINFNTPLIKDGIYRFRL